MQGGERPAHDGITYAQQVADYLQAFSPIGNPSERIWRAYAFSHVAPQFTTFKSNTGEDQRFDIVLVKSRMGVRTGSDHLVVEAKSSHDPRYVTTGAKEFLNKVVRVGPLLQRQIGTAYFFAFVSPIAPQLDIDPRTFSELGRLTQVVEGLMDRPITPEEGGALLGKVFFLNFSPEHHVVHGIGGNNAA
jgi:hypothetical protein